MSEPRIDVSQVIKIVTHTSSHDSTLIDAANRALAALLSVSPEAKVADVQLDATYMLDYARDAVRLTHTVTTRGGTSD